MSRRRFLSTAARGGAGLVVLASAASAYTAQANEKVNAALVGVGGRGDWFVGLLPKITNLVAICEVNDKRAAEQLKKLEGTPRYHDYRLMLDEKAKDLDAVVIAAPDHHHAPCAIRAMKMGKHVYCEKPLTRDVTEARLMRLVARETKVATQMGNQGAASGPFRRALELLWAGKIGDMTDVHVWNDGGGSGRPDAPSGDQPVPDWVKYDLWLGSAEARPFDPEWLKWHTWRDFATGQLGNWAVHSSNLAFKALKIDSLWSADPATKPVITVEAETSGVNRVSFPRWEKIRWRVPARGPLPPITLTWHNGRGPGSRDVLEGLVGEDLDWGDKKEKKWADHAGLVIAGTKGKLHATGHNASFRLLPLGEFDDPGTRPETLPNSRGHEAEWLDAIRGGPAAWSNFDYGGPLTEFLLLGNVATQLPGPLEYDPLAGRIVNNAEADKALLRPHREGWGV
jgi:hypothetical protein